MIFKRFNEITRVQVDSDTHMHSIYSDGKGSPMEIAIRAGELGLHAIAITDHIRETSTYFNEYVQDIKAVREKTGLKMLIGFEARIKNFNGELDVSQENAKKAEVKIGSVHRFSIGKELYAAKMFSVEMAQDLELEIALSGVTRKSFDILGHPGGMCLRSFKQFPLAYFEEIIIACQKNEVVFEINSGYHQAVYQDLIPVLKKHNPLVTFASDAHVIEHIGQWSSLLKDF